MLRKSSNSDIMRSIGSGKKNKSGKNKSFHSGVGAVGHGRLNGPASAAKKQQEEIEDVSLPELLKELSRSQESPSGRKELDLQVPPTTLQAVSKVNWKAQVAHQSRNAVVKILCTVVSFDWEQPYRRLDDAQSIGSGFFVSKDGYIVTNAHVVEDAAKVWITVPSEGERRFNVEVIGVCFDADLALLRSKDAPVQTFLELGDSNAVQYGQEVLTLGYPLGMDSLKLTEGIISGREENFFQTDAPLNPGNSGGPMLNEEGKVIGVNVAIVEKSQNVGFAIPVFNLTMLFESMKNRPKNSRVIHKPILGADLNNSSEIMQQFKGCPGYGGVYITKAYEGFPLHNAGVRDGDILHKFDGYELDNFGEAQVPWSPYARASIETLMTLTDFSTKPEIEWTHDGKRQKAILSFEDPKRPGYPILPAIREYYPPYEKIDHEIIGGVVVMELTLNHIALFHETKPSESVLRFLTPIAASFSERLEPSVVITNVLLGSTCAKYDVFEPGTVLAEVNGIKVQTLKDFREAVLKPVKKDGVDFITFMSKQNELVVMNLHQSLKEEFELSEIYMYNVSPLVLQTIDHNNSLISYISEGDEELEATIKSSIKNMKEKSKKQ